MRRERLASPAPAEAGPRPAPLAPESAEERRSYRAFWADVGRDFPDLGGAASTAYYLECERRLFDEHLGPLAGRRILKTDLWDEAKNTRILRWAAAAGARAYGVDISPAIVGAAAKEFARRRLALGGVVGDVRAIPFADGAVDRVYSMGTVEHFPETELAIREIRRVLAPGGVAVVGVPNRWDPFLRPLLVAVLYRLGLYGYGFERSFSRRRLAGMCERAGLDLVAEDGILFIPGWLRMLDLACWVWCRPLARLTALAVRPFAWLYRRFPSLRRHGYLIAAVVRRPGGAAP